MPYGPPARQPSPRVTAADIRDVTFGKPPFGKRGYEETEVDDFLRRVTDWLDRVPGAEPVSPDDVHAVEFRKARLGSRGYDEDEVDAFLDQVEAELRWRASQEGQAEQVDEDMGPAVPVFGPGYPPGPTGGGSTGAGGPPGTAGRVGPGGAGGTGGVGGVGGTGGTGGTGAAPAAHRVRACAMVVITDRGRLLVTENPDPTTGRTVYRPPSGDVAFGERGHEAAQRTFGEEFGIRLGDVRPLATLEDISRFAGQDRHELVLVYEAESAEAALWTQQRLLGRRGQAQTSAIWVPTELFRRGEVQLAPEGMLALLDALTG